MRWFETSITVTAVAVLYASAELYTSMLCSGCWLDVSSTLGAWELVWVALQLILLSEMFHSAGVGQPPRTLHDSNLMLINSLGGVTRMLSCKHHVWLLKK
jgi:hypothetical protein